MHSTKTLTCSDGYSLAISQFSQDAPKGIIVLTSAFGVSQDYYWPMAEFLVKQGFSAYCFDFRGTGSNSKTLPVDFKLADWGSLDLEAVLAEALTHQLPVHVIGHSIGGQLLGLAPSSKQLTSTIFVASSSPYWKRWPRLADGLKVRVNVGMILPLVSRFYKAFPAQKFGLGNQDLPPKAVQDWAKWMSKPDYLFDPSFGLDVSNYNELSFPILSLGFKDDALAPMVNIHHLMLQFQQADCTTKCITPKSVDAKHIGHTGFFKPRFESSLWPQVIDFFEDHSG